ncbi:uncharacterized protein CANTADRAFT_20050 [Suhomyces tanzawaensis NRRL Y-17324]|uniref:DUF7702 domain-containing protein n=1 Tax=Suhomyces tanzawaensis NRRL Y-17324 TaxID=984487 RepID=A0A1E4SM19_9ASCO|nr:uncharacterized protein CANTADRAFT_20050 [Suhomyces tanzawaensis NRRL Y-17324]ODV80457.1 hypothetical protein CANTADRAFT_20050 [Suhomyces tanzawaensis NRRL Y-17324]
MQVQFYTQWEVVSYVQTIWFAFLLLVHISLIVMFISKPGKKKSMLMFGAYFGVFCTLKMIGGITSIVTLHASTFNRSAYTAAYICDSVAIGLLIKSTFPFLETMKKQDGDEKLEWKLEDKLEGFEGLGRVGRFNLHPFRLLTILVLVSMILAIVGTVQITSASSSDSKSDSDSPELKIGSFLFLASTLVLLGLLLWTYCTVSHFQVILRIFFAVVPLLIVRCCYSIISALKGINFDDPSKYAIIFGDYKYYTFLAFLSEGLIGPVLLIVFNWFLRNNRAEF